jgi:hypothetical protein
MELPRQTEIRATYRDLLARGLQPGEAANLTAFLHGLASTNLHWSVREVEALVVQRDRRAAGRQDGLDGPALPAGTTSATTS